MIHLSIVMPYLQYSNTGRPMVLIPAQALATGLTTSHEIGLQISLKLPSEVPLPPPPPPPTHTPDLRMTFTIDKALKVNLSL